MGGPGSGRRRQPTVLKMARGAYDKNPRLKNDQEPQPAQGIPPCPKHLGPIGQTEWKWVTTTLAGMGMATLADRPTIELYCLTYERLREAELNIKKEGAVITEVTPGKFGDKETAKRNPWELIAKDAALACDRLLSRLGLNPAARGGMRVDGLPTGQVDRRKRG